MRIILPIGLSVVGLLVALVFLYIAFRLFVWFGLCALVGFRDNDCKSVKGAFSENLTKAIRG